MDRTKRVSLNAERLTLVSPSIRQQVIGVLQDVEGAGFEPLIAKDVWRSPARQLELYRQGRSKAKWGFHCGTTPEGKPDSLAADIVDADFAWDAKQAFWLAVGRAAFERGLGWGGFWGLKPPQKAALEATIISPPAVPIKIALGWDVAHVEVAGISISEAKAGKRPTANTPSPSVTPPARPVLKRGDRGEAVTELQTKLRKHVDVHVDGHFGPATERALRLFQRMQNLISDGQAGPAVYKALGL